MKLTEALKPQKKGTGTNVYKSRLNDCVIWKGAVNVMIPQIIFWTP